jgi:anion-transporting  ArsA/GET3 family ATPase
VSAPVPRVEPLGTLLGSARGVIACGPGGVGKTSVAAALAVAAAERGRRVCVLTIDPARRLAQALGLDGLGNEPTPVEGLQGAGNLDAMMLDVRRTFDDLVRRTAPSPGQADAIIATPMYQRLASFGGTQEFMAAEKLHQLHASGRWDLLVVDTPPTRSALDFLDAPDRMLELLRSRMGALTGPVRSLRGVLRGLGLAATPLTQLVGRVVGTDLLGEVTKFLGAIEGMYDDARERANKVRDLLRASETAFVVVATPDESALWEAAFLAGRLGADRLRLGAVVVNRVHRAASLPRVSAAARKALAAAGGRDPGAKLLGALLDAHRRQATLATAERKRIGGLLAAAPGAGAAQVQVPLLGEDPTDLPGLRALAGHLLA